MIHPADAGIPYISDHVENISKGMVFCNGKNKFGRIQNGVPDEVWAHDVLAHPLRELSPEHMGVFMPVKFQTMIRQGCVDKTIDGVLYRFSSPDFARLGAGYRLAVAFDPGEPAAGAEIYNLETGSRNVDGHKPNAWICHAAHEAELPLFGYSAEVNSGERRAHRRAFSGLRGHGPVRQEGRCAIERREADGAWCAEVNLGLARRRWRSESCPSCRGRNENPHPSAGSN